jgi:hypothetical protein
MNLFGRTIPPTREQSGVNLNWTHSNLTNTRGMHPRQRQRQRLKLKRMKRKRKKHAKDVDDGPHS